MRSTIALLPALPVLAAVAQASASNPVFVCAKDLCAGGKRVAWVEIRANVVFGGFDFRRYSARLDGSDARQEASNGAIWTVPASAGAPKRLLRRARQPAWSK